MALTDNPRAVAGDNQPAGEPPFSAEWSALDERRRELVANASAWLNTVQVITTGDQAARAGGFRKQLVALRNKAKKAATDEMRPHKERAEVVGKRYDGIKQACSISLDLLDPLLEAWLKREDDRKAAELAEAQRLAAERQAAADAAIALAQDTRARAARGELAGSKVDTVGQIAEAERLRQVAEDAQRAVERIDTSKPMIAGEFLSGAAARSISMSVVAYDYVITDLDAVLGTAHDDGAEELREAAEAYVRRKHKADRTWICEGVTIKPIEAPR